MECITAIGTGIIGKIAEYTVKPVGRQVGYVFQYKRNLRKLQSQVTDLDAARESLERKIAEEERKGRKVLTFVTRWLTDVNKITEEAKEFLKDEHQVKIKCRHGFCPNLMARHHLSRKSTKLVQDIVELYGKKNFVNIAYDVTPEEVFVISTKDYEAYDSRTSVVNNVMGELRNSNTNMIGVYGIGGVGKTTLLKEIYKQTTKGERLFDEVVMVLDLKHNPSIERIQKEIAEKLGLNLHELVTPAGRARHICSRIKEKKTLVILDDVQENFDLEAVGLPHMETLKILLTSRSKIVLARDMGTEKDFHLDVLDKKETWSLFQKMAGDIVKEPDIQTVATQVAEKCGGLPLLIVTVARALKNSPLHAWKDTFRRLERLDGQPLTDKAYNAIEWSYSKLENEELKSLFLLCANQAACSNTTDILDLCKYSMGLGLIKNVETMDEARDALDSLLETLRDSCLLLDSDDNQCVRIHDLVKDVAKWITTRDQQVLSLSHRKELKEWPDENFCEKCTMISIRECNIIPKLPEVLQCQQLTMFHLSGSTDNSSQEIPCNFFKEMKKLRVLDLTRLSMPSLPSSLQFLKNLRTLCLDQCTLGDIALVGQLQNLEILSLLRSKFEQLPKEIGQLIRLRLLDLTGCSELKVISPNVLSSLKRLEHLRMGNSFNQWEVGRVISNKRSNANLDELKNLHQLTALQIHIPDANMLPADLFTTKLKRFQICIGSAWKWGDVDEALNTLKVQLTTRNELDQGLKMLLNRTDDLYLEGTLEGVNNSIVCQLGPQGFQKLKHLHVQNNAEFTCIINEKVGFPNLTWLAVSELNGLRFLLSYSMARSLAQLKHLEISGCQIMQEIVSIEESDKEIEENMFCQLQKLELKDLPNLTKLCSRSYIELPNPSFERLQLENSSKQDNFLFDNKVLFPNLKELTINRVTMLTTIWHDKLAEESSKNLESLEVDSCENLKHIFPASMVRGLQQLRVLAVRNCGIVEEIIANEEGQQTTPKFVFSKVTRVNFEDLPQLGNFYPARHISSWPILESLKVVRCNKLEIFAEELSSFQGKQSNLLSTPTKQTLFSIEKVGFPKLTLLEVSELNGLRFLLSSSMAGSIAQLECLHIHGCEIMEEIVSIEESDEQIAKNMFYQLQHLELKDLPNLTKFCSRHYNEFPNSSLERLQLENSSKQDNFLFDNKVQFPNLRKLYIDRLTMLTTIWDDQLAEETLKNLGSLEVDSCENLKHIFPASLARGLQQLRVLVVTKCGVVEEIIANEVGQQTTPKFVFSKVIHVNFEELPQLRSFYPARHVSSWPTLESLKVVGCNKLEIFAEEFSSFQGKHEPNCLATPTKQILFSIDEVGFPKLTLLEVSELNGLRFLLSSSMARSLAQLECLHIHGCEIMEEIVSIEESDEQIAKNMFYQLQHLELKDLPNLTKFCSRHYIEFPNSSLERLQLENSSKQDNFLFDNKVQFTNLRKLYIDRLTMLTTIWDDQLAEETLKNLESLEVDSCENLKHIFPASLARGLQQLRVLVVTKCGVVEEIIANEVGQQTTPKFVFSKVIHVNFEELPQLRSFYPARHVSSWPTLESLKVVGCNKLEIFAEEFSSFQGKHEPNCLATPTKQILFSIDEVGFPKLTLLEVSELNGLRFLLSSSMARSLAQLECLHIHGCEIMEEIVSIEESDEQIAKNMFYQLQHLELKDLPNLTKFCSRHYNEFPNSSLERLQLENSSKQDNFLFDNKVQFPNLRKLYIDRLTMLTTIWDDQLAEETLKNLKSLEVDSCENLKHIFPAFLARGLQQLRVLVVTKCGVVEEIIANEMGQQTTPKFVFSKVTLVIFEELPQLRSFYPARHVSSWPMLESLRVVRCNKLKILAEELSCFAGKHESNLLSTSTKQTLFSIDKDSFPNLEDLKLCRMEIWNSPLPVKFFSKLKSLTVCCSKSKSVVFLEKLLDEVNYTGKIHAVEIGTLPHLRKLDLNLMPNLMNLGEDNSQSAGTNFPELDILRLTSCHSLTNLRSSAISFNNLTTLQISRCPGLKYLITHSMARSLMQLTKLEVEKCPRLVEIVGSNEKDEDDSGNEITFRRLKHLKLSILPKLRGFCSGYCIVKFPSLESLSISNRLKLKILQTIGDETLQTLNEEEDTDVDGSEAEMTPEVLRMK